jgi:protein subunit release factor B
MKVLKARLYEKKMQEQEEKLKSMYSEKQKIEWAARYVRMCCILI